METNTTIKKDFDCVQFVREQRERISDTIKDMSPDEIVAHFNKVAKTSDLRKKG